MWDSEADAAALDTFQTAFRIQRRGILGTILVQTADCICEEQCERAQFKHSIPMDSFMLNVESLSCRKTTFNKAATLAEDTFKIPAKSKQDSLKYSSSNVNRTVAQIYRVYNSKY